MTFYLIQRLNFGATEEIFIEASYAFNALVGALRHSEAACTALRGEVLLETPLVISDVATTMYSKRIACKKIICVWTCLYPIQILTGTL